MKRIAYIFEGFLHAKLGVFNAVINRARHLAQVAHYDVDVYMLQVYDGWFVRRLRHSRPVTERPQTVVHDGVTIHMMWCKRDIRDSFSHRVLHREPTHFIRFLRESARCFEGYALVCAHDRMAGQIAEEAGRLYGIPWYVTWHGGNNVTDMLADPVLRRITTRLIENATCNFMVSRGLVDVMRAFTPDFRWQVLLNGANDTFRRYSDDERAALRRHYDVPTDVPVVAFVGRFEPVKNVLLLPEIFEMIREKLGRDVLFWAIGDGFQRPETEHLMAQRPSVNCRFWGAVDYDEMPRMMNCVDLIVLPSSLEGLPLVLVEAMQCGAHAVASDVAGNAEAVGRDNAFALDDRFVDRLTTRAAAMLRGEVTQTLPAEISWQATATKENQIYLDAVKSYQ